MVGKHAHLAADMVSSSGGCRNAAVDRDPFEAAAKYAYADNRSGSNDALEPAGRRRCSNRGIRRLSALYQAPMQEPLVFSEDSLTDIPQVNGSCLRPSGRKSRR